MPKGTRGFVPTMGALHIGHTSLLDAARDQSDETVLSIFVNPIQFGPHEDLSRYPRPIEDDLALAEAHGADWVFLPSAEEVYPLGLDAVRVHLPGISERFEGAVRPGHFDGVTTVVLRLFNIVRPNYAFFGRKDLQQCAVIQRMVASLGLDLDIRICPTIREPSGLAYSSRNAYMTDKERESAPILSLELSKLASGTCTKSFKDIEEDLAAAKRALSAVFEVEYLSLIDEETFREAEEAGTRQSFAAAVRLPSVRLIDNIQAQWPCPEDAVKKYL